MGPAAALPSLQAMAWLSCFHGYAPHIPHCVGSGKLHRRPCMAGSATILLPPSPVLLNRLIARCTLRHVQVLLMLAETGTARRAAEAVGVSPASLEHLLSELEDILE